MTTHNSTVLLEYGKITAVAGLQWQAVPTGRRGLARLTREKGRQVNRRVVCRGAQRQVAGFCALAGKTHRGSLYSLAMLALPTLGRNGYGVVDLDDGRQVFLATLDGCPAVMGDVVGSPSDIAAQLADFLAFNPDVDWRVVGTPAVPADWHSLLSAKPAASARLRTVHSRRPLLAGLLLAGVSVACYVAWDQWRQAQDAADLAARRAAFEASQQQQITDPAVPVLPHPWAAQLPASVFLAQCQQAWQQAPLSIAGWTLSGGECRSDGLRLGYDGSAGEPVDVFKARVDTLLGQQASFNLPAGGAAVRCLLPCRTRPASCVTRFPGCGHPAIAGTDTPATPGHGDHLHGGGSNRPGGPGARCAPPIQEWREFTFTVSSTLPSATVFHPLADTGLRLARVTFTLTGGQLRYETEGHLYAYK